MNMHGSPLHLAIRLKPWHRRSTHTVVLLVWLTGVLWLGFHYFLQVPGSFGPRPHPLEAWWLSAHGLTAMLSLMVLGSVLPVHVTAAWRRERNVTLGIALVGSLVWLAATGYALYYFVDGDGDPLVARLHWLPGLLLPLLAWLHVRIGRRRAGPDC